MIVLLWEKNYIEFVVENEQFLCYNTVVLGRTRLNGGITRSNHTWFDRNDNLMTVLIMTSALHLIHEKI